MTTYSVNAFTVTGGESDYNLSFAGDSPGYIEQSHVKYYIGNVKQGDSSRVFLTSTQVRIDPVPPDGTEISFRRESSPETPLVDWVSGQAVTEVNLDTLTLQMLYLTQESADRGAIDLTDVENFTNLAQAWAEQAEDSEVQSGLYSAKHHALKAASSALQAASSASSASTSSTTAGGYKDDAQAALAAAIVARDAAQDAQAAAEIAAESITVGTEPTNIPNNSMLGSAAYKDTGTASGNVVELDATGLPAVDGSQLTGIVTSTATTAEAQAGTDNTKAITPLRMREGFNATGSAPIYACRAWVNFNGTDTVAIRASGNVSSITDNGTGDYTVNFATDMPDVNYSTIVTGSNLSGFANPVMGCLLRDVTKSTSLVRVVGKRASTEGFVDDSDFQVSIFR